MAAKRFILLGFDGLNPEFVERFIDELPNLRRLIGEGSWGPMLPVVPVDTPTNWCSLATGATAATHRITGFESWKEGTSLATLLGPGQAYRELRAAEFLWEAADRQGKRSLLVNYPFSWFSKEGLKNTVIVGGDSVKGGASQIHGSEVYCTADLIDEAPEAHEIVLRPEGDGYVGEIAFGPSYKTVWTAIGQEATDELEDAGAGVWARIRTVPGTSPAVVIEDVDGRQVASLRPGEVSPHVKMRIGKEDGWLKFLVVDLSADGRSLHMVQFMITRSDGWTKPGQYALQLLNKVGPYQQSLEADGGMDRWGGLGKGRARIDADIHLLDSNGRILAGYCDALTDVHPDWDHLYLQLHSTDGYNHRRLMHLLPESYPYVNAEESALAWEWLLENYRAVDRIVGRMADMAAAANAVLCIVSDHSAVPCHTWVDTARPFIERGLLHFSADGCWDPARSKIRFSFNHSIYLNLRGRHPDGIVDESETEALRNKIIVTLLTLSDPKRGELPVALAARKEDVPEIGCGGPTFGDVVYYMRPGYTDQPSSRGERVTQAKLNWGLHDGAEAWHSGYGAQKGLVGTHIDALPAAAWPGLCSNRSVLLFHGPGIRAGHRIRNAQTIDIAPTLAHLAGIGPPAQCEGGILTHVLA